jgi:hypothetical protein
VAETPHSSESLREEAGVATVPEFLVSKSPAVASNQLDATGVENI